MIITFKEAPELGRLKVVKDIFPVPRMDWSCDVCIFARTEKCRIPSRAGFDCVFKDIHFVKAKP